jgi:SAM-dependent methyltransferase
VEGCSIVADDAADTRDSAYADRLVRLGETRWKRVLNVQAPYRWNLRRLQVGNTLDVGCGTGRNLLNLGAGSVGVDHNAKSVEIARSRQLEAFTVEEFHASFAHRQTRFDTLLLAHVAEHMEFDAAVKVIEEYRSYLRPHAQLVLICPQEAGYRSDPTHITFFDLDQLRRLSATTGAEVNRAFSFPFPRPIGRVFRYNEFVVVGRFQD